MSRYSGTRQGDPPPAPEPLAVRVPDSHCHLDLMEVDVAEAVAAAGAVGIGPVVTIGIDVATSRWAAEAAASYDGVFAAVAVHPNESPTAPDEDWDEIARLATLPGVVAVGETGLDRFRTGEEGWRRQEESFRRHIAIAKDAGKALVIHDRDAHDEVLRVLESEGAPDSVVFHCFSGDEHFARACADRGYYMSFAGNVTFTKAEDLRAAARVVPTELLLVETDAPFLTPMPFRGRPNAPYLVPLTVMAVTAVREAELEGLSSAIATNTAKAFGWDTAASGPAETQ